MISFSNVSFFVRVHTDPISCPSLTVQPSRLIVVPGILISILALWEERVLDISKNISTGNSSQIDSNCLVCCFLFCLFVVVFAMTVGLSLTFRKQSESEATKKKKSSAILGTWQKPTWTPENCLICLGRFHLSLENHSPHLMKSFARKLNAFQIRINDHESF